MFKSMKTRMKGLLQHTFPCFKPTIVLEANRVDECNSTPLLSVPAMASDVPTASGTDARLYCKVKEYTPSSDSSNICSTESESSPTRSLAQSDTGNTSESQPLQDCFADPSSTIALITNPALQTSNSHISQPELEMPADPAPMSATAVFGACVLALLGLLVYFLYSMLDLAIWVGWWVLTITTLMLTTTIKALHHPVSTKLATVHQACTKAAVASVLTSAAAWLGCLALAVSNLSLIACTHLTAETKLLAVQIVGSILCLVKTYSAVQALTSGVNQVAFSCCGLFTQMLWISLQTLLSGCAASTHFITEACTAVPANHWAVAFLVLAAYNVAPHILKLVKARSSLRSTFKMQLGKKLQGEVQQQQGQSHNLHGYALALKIVELALQIEAEEDEKYFVEGDHIGASPHVFDDTIENEAALPSSTEMGTAIEDLDNVCPAVIPAGVNDHVTNGHVMLQDNVLFEEDKDTSGQHEATDPMLPSLEEEWIAYEGRSIAPGGVDVAVDPVAIEEVQSSAKDAHLHKDNVLINSSSLTESSSVTGISCLTGFPLKSEAGAVMEKAPAVDVKEADDDDIGNYSMPAGIQSDLFSLDPIDQKALKLTVSDQHVMQPSSSPSTSTVQTSQVVDSSLAGRAAFPRNTQSEATMNYTQVPVAEPFAGMQDAGGCSKYYESQPPMPVRQSACEAYMRMSQATVMQYGPHQLRPLVMQSPRLASAGREEQMRIRYGSLMQREKEGPWTFAPHACSPAMWIVDESDASCPSLWEKCAYLGKGQSGNVYYAEVEMKDGYRAPCAVKRMPYHTQLEQEVADAELEALLATHDLQGIVTCRALFEHSDQDGRRCLHLATDYCAGVDLNFAIKWIRCNLQHLEGTPALDAWLMAARKDITQKLVWALGQLHELGLGHGDLKPCNIRVSFNPDFTVGRVTIVDLGSCAHFSGCFCDKPVHVRITPGYSAPEMVRSFCGYTQEWIDARAQDAWALGCIIMALYCEQELFEVGTANAPYTDYMELHDLWASTYDRLGVDDGTFNVPASLQRCVSDQGVQGSVCQVLEALLEPEMQNRYAVQELAQFTLLL